MVTNYRRAAMAAVVFGLGAGQAQGAAFQLREGDPDWLANAPNRGVQFGYTVVGATGG